MKSEEIKVLFAQFENASVEVEGVECWSARELQELLGYSKWENFSKVVEKAKESCLNAGQKIGDHFPDVRKMVEIGSGAEKEINDILLTALFHLSTATLKRKLGAPNNRPVADFLHTVNLQAKDLASGMTSVNVQAKDLKGAAPIETEHVDNNAAVRKMLLERGIVPEQLPPAEDIKKVERKIKSDEKKALANI
ncbi:MAG: damage-inducible protein D [Prevotellaceae bacterium]|nr:damage-inducible protein D [Prevotellaceae bacterium]